MKNFQNYKNLYLNKSTIVLLYRLKASLRYSVFGEELRAIKERRRNLVSVMLKHVPCKIVAPFGCVVADWAVECSLRYALYHVATHTPLTGEMFATIRALVLLSFFW